MPSDRKLQPEDVLVRMSAVQHAPLGAGVVLRHREGLTVLDGFQHDEIRRVLEQVDGHQSAVTICDRLAATLEPAVTRRILRGLLGEVLEYHSALEARTAVHQKSWVSGGAPTHRTGNHLATTQGMADVRIFGDSSTAHHLLALLPGSQLETTPTATTLEGVSLLLVVGEGLPYRRLLEAQKAALAAAVPTLCVTADGDGIRCGPSSIPGLSPCLGCAQLTALEPLGRPPEELLALAEAFGSLSIPHPEAIAQKVAQEAVELLHPAGTPRWTSGVWLEGWDGAGRSLSLSRRVDCPLCGTQPPPSDGPLTRRVERQAIVAQERSPRRGRPASDDPLVKTVGILGGGTAGYLAALALRRHHPELQITLIESSRVPVIGVGEATTPLMPQFLHADLDLDIHDFFHRVQPTLKLGIRFVWGPREEHTFNYPFGPSRVLEAMAWDGHLRHASLQGMLMNAKAVPLESPFASSASDEGRSSAIPRSYLDTEIAYHLDNRRFVGYLAEHAEARGIHRVDARIVSVELDPAGEEIQALVAEEGRRFSFDFYLDCSGFRSLLLGETLGSPFHSFDGSLFTDRAVVATAPHDGVVAPYTVARGMDAGWCWNTPQRQEDHRGYVFSSAFLSDEAAIAEMRRKNPGLGDPRLVHFRPGRRQHFMKGNTVALGGSYGFVEPLESTALHMLIRQIGLLLRAFPLRRGERGLAASLNRRMGASWDYLRWFLALHYRFNRAIDTPFWRHCRTAVDVSSHAELLAAFGERGPLSFDPTLSTSFDYPDPLWGPEGIDVILLGQGVPTQLPRPVIDPAKWHAHVLRCQRVVERSLQQAEALRHLDRSPGLLASFAETFRRVGPAFGGPRR